MRAWLFVLACVVTWAASAQVSTEDAEARLKAKSAERTATTQSASGDVEQLRRVVRQLQAQVASLQDENAKLRADLVEAKKPTAAPAKARAGKRTTTSLADGAKNFNNKLTVGMTVEEAETTLGRPTGTRENGDGSKILEWKVLGGSFNSALPSDVRRLVTARVGADGKIQDFTDEK